MAAHVPRLSDRYAPSRFLEDATVVLATDLVVSRRIWEFVGFNANLLHREHGLALKAEARYLIACPEARCPATRAMRLYCLRLGSLRWRHYWDFAHLMQNGSDLSTQPSSSSVSTSL